MIELHTAPAAPELGQQPPLPVFAPVAIEFVQAFSCALHTASQAAGYPELAALAFWMRGAHLAQLRDRFFATAAGATFLPRGTVFHIAPANVDSMFVYSWFLSLLCGNRNIVRLPSRLSPQLALLEGILRRLLAEPCWQAVANRTLLVRYERSDRQATTLYSSLCDLRVVWGGDATITELRGIALPPLAGEICFANRFSLAVIQAEGWNAAPARRRQVWLGRFFQDAYAYGQMACSSPRLVVWHGAPEAVQAAQDDFWPGLRQEARRRGSQLQALDYVNKLLVMDRIAMRLPVRLATSGHNDVCRVETGVEQLKALIDSGLHCGAGLFYESRAEHLDALVPALDRRIQTLTHAGYADASVLRDFVVRHGVAGVDRIVPFGRALEFSPVWDGHDLFRVFTRQLGMA